VDRGEEYGWGSIRWFGLIIPRERLRDKWRRNKKIFQCSLMRNRG
jgi:hypothetical protein